MKVKFKYRIQKSEIRGGHGEFILYSEYWVEASCEINGETIISISNSSSTKLSPSLAKSYKEQAKQSLIEIINRRVVEDEYMKQINRIFEDDEVEI